MDIEKIKNSMPETVFYEELPVALQELYMKFAETIGMCGKFTRPKAFSLRITVSSEDSIYWSAHVAGEDYFNQGITIGEILEPKRLAQLKILGKILHEWRKIQENTELKEVVYKIK